MLGKVDHREALAGRGPLEVSPAVLANYNHSHACDYHPALSCREIRRQCTLFSNRFISGSSCGEGSSATSALSANRHDS